MRFEFCWQHLPSDRLGQLLIDLKIIRGGKHLSQNMSGRERERIVCKKLVSSEGAKALVWSGTQPG